MADVTAVNVSDGASHDVAAAAGGWLIRWSGYGVAVVAKQKSLQKLVVTACRNLMWSGRILH